MTTDSMGPDKPQPLPSGEDHDSKPMAGIKPPEVDFMDYLSHQVAERAKKQVLAYFGLATIAVSVVVTLIGWQEMKKLLESKYEGRVEIRASEADARVKQLQRDFEKRLGELGRKAEQETAAHSLFIASVRSQLTTTDVASSVDLSANIGPIRDQGAEGTTIGFSLAYAMNAEWLRSAAEERTFSARSIYIGAKERDEWPGTNYEGSSLAGGVKALQQAGAALESDWPYATKVAPASRTLPRHKIRSFQRLKTTRDIIDSLKSGSVVAVSFTITDEFRTAGADGKVILRPDSPIVGGHSVAVVGWNEKAGEFKFANMWGVGWGASGFGYIRETDLARILTDAYRLQV